MVARKSWISAVALVLASLSAPALAGDDPLLGEIQARFHATKRWFGMVSDLKLDRAKDGSITPRFETLRSPLVIRRDPAGMTLRARLPKTAAGAMLIQSEGVDGFWVRTQEVGVQSVPAEIRRGLVVYPGALAGGDLLYKLTPTHVDEYLYLRHPPAHLTRELELDAGHAVATLRQAEDRIEVLGRDGVARLRLSAPFARGADGTRRNGTVRLEGRRIIEDIDLAGLVPPVLVDPDWATTGTMTIGHWQDAAWRRPDDKVMVIGGCTLTGCPSSFAQSACNQVIASTDVWDPASGTWTTGPSMLMARYAFGSVPLPNGDLLVVGGCTAAGCAKATAQAERFLSGTKTWFPAGALTRARGNPMATPSGGEVIIAGGCDGTDCATNVERYTVATGAWANGAPLPAARGLATATTLSDGRVLLIGGCADAACATVLPDAVVYDPAADTWSPAGIMSTPRAGHTATLLGDGSVLVAGGCPDASCNPSLNGVEIWKASGGGGAFTSGAPMIGMRHNHTATMLDSGDVLIAGGADVGGSTIPTSEVYVTADGQWQGTTAMLMSRAYHTGTALGGGKALIAGGCNPQTCMPWAEVFTQPPVQDLDAGVPDADASPDDGGMPDATVDAGPAPLPDSPHPAACRTGIVTCQTESEQDQTCPILGYELQDGDFQPNTQSFAATAPGEVTDGATGLVWQATEDPDGYDAASAVKHCQSFATPNAPAGSWRLPSVVELSTIIDYAVGGPSMDPAFVGAQPGAYWTSTTVFGAKMLTWTVKFDAGELLPLLPDTKLPVRCVRGQSDVIGQGGSLRKAGMLTTDVETVRDESLGLEWQRADDGVKRSWKDSLAYCAELGLAGKTGWHLPNVSELTSIVQFDAFTDGVSLDPAFQNGKADLYWTSSQNEGVPTLSWGITFNLGVVDGVTVSGLGYVRCVRHFTPAPKPDGGVPDGGMPDAGDDGGVPTGGAGGASGGAPGSAGTAGSVAIAGMGGSHAGGAPATGGGGHVASAGHATAGASGSAGSSQSGTAPGAQPTTDSSGGCGCSVQAGSNRGWLAVAAGIAVALRRRRRR